VFDSTMLAAESQICGPDENGKWSIVFVNARV
jgi:hypothetical protein